jgi:CRISPR-associated protein Csx16
VTLWFVSRHPGALEWMRKNHIPFDRHVPHLEVDDIRPGDEVIGSLPINLAAEVCARGATYRHLSLRLDIDDRGRELSAQELERYDACLESYFITKRPA